MPKVVRPPTYAKTCKRTFTTFGTKLAFGCTWHEALVRLQLARQFPRGKLAWRLPAHNAPITTFNDNVVKHPTFPGPDCGKCAGLNYRPGHRLNFRRSYRHCLSRELWQGRWHRLRRRPCLRPRRKHCRSPWQPIVPEHPPFALPPQTPLSKPGYDANGVRTTSTT